MKKYNFLFKPLFFIFSLVFATWLVLYIEKTRPSDFGKYEYLFKEPKPAKKHSGHESLKTHSSSLKFRQTYLKKICMDYKTGLIDSTTLNQQLEKFLLSLKEVSTKQD